MTPPIISAIAPWSSDPAVIWCQKMNYWRLYKIMKLFINYITRSLNLFAFRRTCINKLLCKSHLLCLERLYRTKIDGLVSCLSQEYGFESLEFLHSIHNCSCTDLFPKILKQDVRCNCSPTTLTMAVNLNWCLIHRRGVEHMHLINFIAVLWGIAPAFFLRQLYIWKQKELHEI